MHLYMYSLHQKPYINYTETIHDYSCSDIRRPIMPQTHLSTVNLCCHKDKAKKNNKNLER